jgi:tetratricopeptide (TPR) repeat protein
VMNRAEHFLVTASFFLLAGYSEDAIKLTTTALNQPDRNGSYSADDAQKDSMAALINMMANRLEYQIQLEKIATMDFFDSLSARADALSFQFNAWRSERRAAALFAEFDVLQNRLRPYAPLDVHIPEWIEPEIVGSIGTGVMSNIIEQANSNGAFMLNAGYYHSYKAEVAALDNDRDAVMREGAAALNQLPAQEVLLRARLAAQMGKVAWRNNDYSQALTLFENAYLQDPSILRRLAISLPVDITNDGTEFSEKIAGYLADSPRFSQNRNGMSLEVSTAPDLTICLKTRTGTILSCYTIPAAENESSKWNAKQLTQIFHTQTFGLGFEISQAQRSILMGSSVILSSQNDRSLQRNREAVMDR